MLKKQIGPRVYENRGDDYYMVNATTDGDIVEVEQYDAIGHRHYSINFFAETAPKLVKLIEKAAGIKAEEVEYEYACQLVPDNGYEFRIPEQEWFDDRSTADLLVKRQTERNALDEAKHGKNGVVFRVVKRRKAGPVEQVED